jgi:hypothetical protein
MDQEESRLTLVFLAAFSAALGLFTPGNWGLLPSSIGFRVRLAQVDSCAGSATWEGSFRHFGLARTWSVVFKRQTALRRV